MGAVDGDRVLVAVEELALLADRFQRLTADGLGDQHDAVFADAVFRRRQQAVGLVPGSNTTPERASRRSTSMIRSTSASLIG